MATIHISEADAARDFPALMAHVRAGEEIVIESDKQPIAILRAATPPNRLISEVISLAKLHEAETGAEPVMDATFAADVEERIARRRPLTHQAWD